MSENLQGQVTMSLARYEELMSERRPLEHGLKSVNDFAKIILDVYRLGSEETKIIIEEKLTELDYTIKGKDPYGLRAEAGMGKKLYLCTYEKA